jgi:hypothetical protein
VEESEGVLPAAQSEAQPIPLWRAWGRVSIPLSPPSLPPSLPPFLPPSLPPFLPSFLPP